MKGRWVSLVVVLVLLNYLIVSAVWSAVSKDSTAAPTATRTRKPTFTAEAEARIFVTATCTPKRSSALVVALTPVVEQPAMAVAISTSFPPTPLPTEFIPVATRATPTPAPSMATPLPSPTPVVHVVKAGEMLLVIANEYDVTVEAIMKANELDSDLIFVGQELTIPRDLSGTPTEGVSTPAPILPEITPVPIATSFVHIVRAGETLESIAAQYGVTVDDIAEANGLESTDLIYVDQRLIIPATGPTSTPGPTSTGRTHVIQAGENLTWIANEYGVAIEALMRANDITDADTIYIGQVLIIP